MTRVSPQRPDLVAKAIAPDYALGAHTASLGLTFNTGNLFPPEMAGGAFVGQHGSWNRKPRAGYKVIFVPFADGKPAGKPQDVLTGFLNDKGEAQGRPVGVRIDKQGALLVADDVGNAVWRVTPAAKVARPRRAARLRRRCRAGASRRAAAVGSRTSTRTISYTRKCLVSFRPCA